MRFPQAITTCLALLCTRASAIVSGAISPQNPYLVSITSSGLLGEYHICGGATIGPQAILTTASCFEDSPASSLRVKYGGNDRTSLQHSNKISRIARHPKWSSQTLNHDYAILRLASPLLDSNGAAKTAFATLARTKPAAGTSVDVSGWGKTSRLTLVLPRQLHRVTMQVLGFPECVRKWKDRTKITPDMGCVESKDSSACNGDLVGPVMDLGRSIVYGVVSFTENGCPADSTVRPNVYADVTEELGWIEQNMA